MIEHFTNTAVYAFIIEDIIVTTVGKLHWNQNVILFLHRGATAIMYMEVWKRFLMARNELFKAANETLKADDESFMEAVHTVRDSINENNTTLSFFSELEKSITKEASGQNNNKLQRRKIILRRKSSKYPLQGKIQKKRSQSEKFLFHQQRW